MSDQYYLNQPGAPVQPLAAAGPWQSPPQYPTAPPAHPSYPPQQQWNAYPPQQYPGFGQPYYPQQPSTNGLAIAGMALGILWLFWIGSLLAVIFGHIALSQIAQRQQAGRGMAIAAVVLGWVGIGWFVVSLLVGVASV